MASQLSAYLPDLKHINLHAMDSRSVTTAVLASAGTALALSAAWVISDYREWIAFGSGGTPPTPSGYWRMTKLRWRALRSGDDMKDASSLEAAPGTKYLRDLPVRQGARPMIIARTMPQRQKPEPLDQKTRKRLHDLPAKYCKAHPDILVYDKSNTEGRTTDAIYAVPSLSGRDPSAKDRILGNEIAHVHPADNSLHLWLSGPDAKQVIEKGWGERFPLSAMGICHRSWIMVYAPRDEREMEVVEEIVRAAIGWLTGVRV